MSANRCARRPSAPISAPPTLRQREVLQAIEDYQRRYKRAATIRDLCEALEIASTKGVEDHLVALERRGLIARDARIARSLRLTEKGQCELAAGGHAHA